MTATTEGNGTMRSFARITMRKLAPLLTAAALTISTPCFAAVLTQAQASTISANIVGAEGIANSAGPSAVVAVAPLSEAIKTIGNAINTMVNDLPKVIPQPQANIIKASVAAAQATAQSAQATPNQAGLQTLETAFNQMGDATNQLAQAFPQNVFGVGGAQEVGGIVASNKALFTGSAAAGNTPQMGLATSRLADGLGVILNVITNGGSSFLPK